MLLHDRDRGKEVLILRLGQPVRLRELGRRDRNNRSLQHDKIRMVLVLGLSDVASPAEDTFLRKIGQG